MKLYFQVDKTRGYSFFNDMTILSSHKASLTSHPNPFCAISFILNQIAHI